DPPVPVGHRLIVATHGGLHGYDPALERITERSPGHAQVILRLEAQPELGAGAEEARQPQGGIGRDSPPSAYDLGDSGHGHVNAPGECIRGKAQGEHEILLEDLSRVNRLEPSDSHAHSLSVAVDNLDVESVAVTPHKADSPSVVDPDAPLSLA